DVPDGVLFVDAPLPSPPRKRPALLAAVAGAALGIFVLAVALTPPRPTLSPGPRTKGIGVAGKEDVPAKSTAVGKAKEGPAYETRSIATEKELADALADDKSLKLVLERDLHIADTGLTYQGGLKRALVVESKIPGRPVTIQIACPAEIDSVLPWAGLTVDGGTVLFKNVNFEVVAEGTPRSLLAGVLVRGGNVTFERCTFKQQVPAEDLLSHLELVPVASVAAWDAGLGTQDKPHLVFRECYFARGQAAVSLKGTVRL